MYTFAPFWTNAVAIIKPMPVPPVPYAVHEQTFADYSSVRASSHQCYLALDAEERGYAEVYVVVF